MSVSKELSIFSIKIDVVCGHLTEALSALRADFRSPSLDVEGRLALFWTLQDCSSRVLETVSDYRPESILYWQRNYKALTGQVVDVISFTGQLALGRVPAIAEACQSINETFIRIHQLELEQESGYKISVLR